MVVTKNVFCVLLTIAFLDFVRAQEFNSVSTGQKEEIFSVSNEFVENLRGSNLCLQVRVTQTKKNACYTGIWVSDSKTLDTLSPFPDLAGNRRFKFALSVYYRSNSGCLSPEIGLIPFFEFGDPVQRDLRLRGIENQTKYTGIHLSTGIKYSQGGPLFFRATLLPYYIFTLGEFHPFSASVSVGFQFFRQNGTENSKPSYDRRKTGKNGIFIVLNPFYSRTNSVFSLGCELADSLTNKVSVICGFWASAGPGVLSQPTSTLNPNRYSILAQPFHILIGNRLKFETGLSGSIHVVRLNGNSFSPHKFGLGWLDHFALHLSVGSRFYFAGNKGFVKVIFGPSLRTYGEHGWHRTNSGHAELSVGWKILPGFSRRNGV